MDYVVKGFLLLVLLVAAWTLRLALGPRIAFWGLDKDKAMLLRRLSARRESIRAALARDMMETEDYLQASHGGNSVAGLEVLRTQTERERRERQENQQLEEECRRSGIAGWRIALVRP